MDRFDAVLIYDGDCPYCSVAATAIKRTDDIGIVSWYDDDAQEFLEAQFGEAPFAMVLVDVAADRVYAGRAAAEELADRAGMPSIVGSLIGDNYDTIAGAVGKLSGRDRDPAPFHETYRLADGARDLFDALAAAAADVDPEEVDADADVADA
ncbi:DUF393 domain-containing protein [Halobacteriales archaeon SW_7_68_16]|nr:MAG: DUF393 domain-containing protein [Halobacteriales archaeon SW_7_68_16]